MESETAQVIIATTQPAQAGFYATRFEKDGLHCRAIHTPQSLWQLCDKACEILLLDASVFDYDYDVLASYLQRNCCKYVFVLLPIRDIEQKDRLFALGMIDYFSSDLNKAAIYAEIKKELAKIRRNETYKIAVYEEDAHIRQQLQTLLQPRGYRLSFVGGGDELFGENALEFDLILIDTAARAVDSTAMLSRLGSGEFAHAAVIVLSDRKDFNIISKALKHGASDYIKKPFILEEVLIKIDMATKLLEQRRQRESGEKLLNEYKEAIDESTIVSKTDTKGIITYANKAFCQISGYSQEELLGKAHNIVRHPDMPKEAFADMWETIQAKKIWRGVVKNRRKNGDHYVVETIIKPILNAHGQISEYIGIRTDITQLENFKNNLQKRLNITNKTFKEVVNLSKEYEKALDAGTIISRTDTQGNIVYANDRFYEITGYGRDEVIGKTHRIIKHEETTDRLYRQMWETITAGRTWSGTLKNRRKDGSEYVVKSVIYPIKNNDGHNLEYMAIRSDITEVVLLHQEIEKTQREVIYKMGEIGETRSRETGEHVKRVAAYSYLLAKLAGLSEDDADLLKNASPMHDIGKVGIADAILLKPGKLNDDEFLTIQEHTTIGHNILKDSDRRLLQTAAIVAHEHHEKYDGSGYPRGLKEEEIHIFGRITAIVDVFDALAHDRVYKKAWPLEKIRALISQERARHFDPRLADLFLENFDAFVAIKNRYSD